MGNNVATFSDQQLEDYEDATFFTRKEIQRVYRKYKSLSPEIVPNVLSIDEARCFRLPMEVVCDLPELRENPFKQRICSVFSSDGSGDMSFEDFLDCFSVFSENASRDVKIHYAFKIYDFDGDGFIDSNDVTRVVETLTDGQLKPEEMEEIVQKVFAEIDMDSDGKLSVMEFSHIIERAPDFVATFHVRI
ncbi:calcium and integrin-binding family member 3-like [Artemia franciscana]|uniref:EF-hand domain-containing protein n=1 Tax=Artemia franciscana TaxID=6661 RepID=A0AA88L0E9_ARTSF|nr:hypothetical protein QYM36_018420 [Artemia franciscana]